MVEKPAIALVGESLVDLVLEGESPLTFTGSLGGSVLNTATVLARLGYPVRFFSEVGEDWLSAWSEAEMARRGLNPKLRRHPGPMPLALVRLDPEGNARYSFHRPFQAPFLPEAGALRGGTVKSAVGLGMLLMDGIGDTLRVSLAADPVEEVKVGYEILKSLKLRANGINFIACPSCSRQNFDVIGTMNQLEQRLEDIRTPMDVAVIGCIVNGPGEAREADVGLTGADPNNLIYLAGEPDHKVSNKDFIDHLESVIRERAAKLEAQRAEAEASLIAKTQ